MALVLGSFLYTSGADIVANGCNSTNVQNELFEGGLLRWFVLGFEVEQAEDGIQGLAKLEEIEVDLILLDVTMPNMDGPTMLAKLRELGLWDDTMIVITADHGEEFQEHGGWWHGTTLYEEQIRVPLIVRAPGLAPRRVSAPVQTIDIAPTLLSMAGVG